MKSLHFYFNGIIKAIAVISRCVDNTDSTKGESVCLLTSDEMFDLLVLGGVDQTVGLVFRWIPQQYQVHVEGSVADISGWAEDS